MKGQWCNYNKTIFCQEATECRGCEIYLCRDSNSQKTNKNVVLQSVTLPNLPFSSDALQTQAGADDTTYPLLITPACTIHPIAQRLEHHNPIRGTVVGDDSSILSRGIPAVSYHLLPDSGARNIFSKPLTPNPAPTIIMRGD